MVKKINVKDMIAKSKQKKQELPEIATKTETEDEEKKIQISPLVDEGVFRNELLIRLDLLNGNLMELVKTIKSAVGVNE